jgi:hypothetical protein
MFFIKQSVDKGRFTFDNIYARACPLGKQGRIGVGRDPDDDGTRRVIAAASDRSSSG